MSKSIVICADGTWFTPSRTDRGRPAPSNVVKLQQALAARDAHGGAIVSFYDPGVGADGGWWSRIKGGAFGVGLDDNVKQAYTALAERYQPGDRVFLFGFSRGAFTVRSLAGLIGRCGLVRREADGRVDPAKVERAYALYRLNPEVADHRAAAAQFKHANAHGGVMIEMLGVWDTVGALGVPVNLLNWIGARHHRFHDVTLGPAVRGAYHALAIDERRKHFLPTLWRADKLRSYQTVEQAWFTGSHGNVGGGYADAGLSDGALAWMLAHAEKHGLAFEPDRLPGFEPDPLGELRSSLTGVFRFLPRRTRTIGAPAFASQRIDGSVYRRVEALADYRPANLFSATAAALAEAVLPAE